MKTLMKPLTKPFLKPNLHYVRRAEKMESAGGHLFGVAQTSKSAVARVSKPAGGYVAGVALTLAHRKRLPASIPSAALHSVSGAHFREDFQAAHPVEHIVQGKVRGMIVKGMGKCVSRIIPLTDIPLTFLLPFAHSILAVAADSAHQANQYMSNLLKIDVSCAFPVLGGVQRSKISLFPGKSHKLLVINKLEQNTGFFNQTQSSLVKPNRA